MLVCPAAGDEVDSVEAHVGERFFDDVLHCEEVWLGEQRVPGCIASGSR